MIATSQQLTVNGDSNEVEIVAQVTIQAVTSQKANIERILGERHAILLELC